MGIFTPVAVEMVKTDTATPGSTRQAGVTIPTLLHQTWVVVTLRLTTFHKAGVTPEAHRAMGQRLEVVVVEVAWETSTNRNPLLVAISFTTLHPRQFLSTRPPRTSIPFHTHLCSTGNNMTGNCGNPLIVY